MTEAAIEPARRRRPAPLDVEVRRVEPLPGGFVRVILGGEALRAFTWPGAASHLKFFPSSKIGAATDEGVGRGAASGISYVYAEEL